MGAEFYESYTGIGALLRSPEMEKEMLRRAQKIKARAEATAPVGDPKNDPHAGRYRDSFTIISGRTGGGLRHNRAFAEVRNVAPEGFYVEYGTSKVEAQHTLLNAMFAARE